MLRLLRRRDFGLLWLGGFVSIAGDWALEAALPFFVYERTGSTVATAGMIVAELAPQVGLGTIAGVFVDRWDRKRVLVAANVLKALVVSALLLAPHGHLWLVYAVAAAQAALASFSTPAEGALLPALAGEADLVAANALNALNNRLGRVVGLPAGGLLLGYVGLDGVVVADAASFVAAALLVAPIAAPATPRTTTAAGSAIAAFLAEWREGLAIVRGDRAISILFAVFALMTFGGTMLDPLYVAWVRDVLHRGPQTYALLTAAHAVAGIAGTVTIGTLARRASPRLLMGWSSVAAGCALLVRNNVPILVLAFALSTFGGFTSVASAIGVDTMAQRTVRDEFRGRVFGALGAVLGLVSLAGAVVGGTAAEAVGTVTMLNVAAGLIALSGLVALRAFRVPTRRGA